MRWLVAGVALAAFTALAPQPARASDEEEASETAEAGAGEAAAEESETEGESPGDEEGAESGGYGGTGIYSTHHALFALANITRDGGASNNDTLGADFRIGYRAHARAAAELQFEWTDRFNESIGGVTTRQFHDNWTLTLNGKLFALTGRWQPYALVGFGAYHVNEKITAGPSIGDRSHDNDGVGRFGAGIDLYGDETIAINLEAAYVKGFGGLIEHDYVSFGWGFLFRY
jgi:opacity protein-like surface antigen